MNELSPVLQEGIASGRCVHLIRDGVKIGVAFVHDVSQIRFDRGLTQAMRCKWEFVPAESPHGRIVAHYPLVEDNPASPYRQEFFLNGDRPQKAVGLSGYWLLQRLARVDSGFIVLAKGDRVQYSRRFVFSEQLRARLNEIAVSLVNDPKPVRTIEGFQRAIQWHMDHFDFTSVKF